MAKVKQPYGETRFVPWIGRDVKPGEVGQTRNRG